MFDVFKRGFDQFLGFSDKGKPDIVIPLPLIVVGNAFILILQLQQTRYFFSRNPGGGATKALPGLTFMPAADLWHPHGGRNEARMAVVREARRAFVSHPPLRPDRRAEHCRPEFPRDDGVARPLGLDRRMV